MATAVMPRWTALVAAMIPVAAYVTVDPAGWYPFGPAKWFAVSVVAAAAVVAVLAEDKIRVPVAATTWWLVLLAWLTLATAVAVDPRLAWIGTAERHLGWFTWLLFAAVFLVGGQLRRRVDVDAVAKGVVVASLAAGTYAVVELTAGRPVEIGVDTSRLGGSFGSAAYLGAATVLAAPVCAGVGLDPSAHRVWRWAAGGGGAVLVMTLVGSGTRGAWIGALLVGATGVVRLATARRITTLCVVGIVGLLAVLAVAPRLGDVTERSVPASSRLDEWALATRVIASAPIVGVGPEGARIAVVGEIDAGYERTYGRELSPDRAHSGPLDMAAIGGVPAALTYVGLLVVVGRSAFAAARRHRPVVAGVGAGVLAYATQQLFLFPIAEVDLVFWLLAGIVVAADEPTTWLVERRSARFAGACVAALATVALFVTGLLGVAADRSARQAARLGAGPVAIERAQRAAELRPDTLRHHLLVADLWARTGTLAGVDAAIEATEAARRWSPHDPIVARSNASYLSRRAVLTGADADVERSLDAWLVVVDDDPNCWSCQLALGVAAALADDAQRARVAWERATTLSDDPLADALLDELDRVVG